MNGYGDFRGYKGLKELVINYLGDRCDYCQSKDNLELHHSKPLYAGGLNTIGNLELVCRKCHDKLHTQLRLIYPYNKQEPNKIVDDVVSLTIEDKVGMMVDENFTCEDIADILGKTTTEVKELMDAIQKGQSERVKEEDK